jgi:hypothetical protein
LDAEPSGASIPTNGTTIGVTGSADPARSTDDGISVRQPAGGLNPSPAVSSASAVSARLELKIEGATATRPTFAAKHLPLRPSAAIGAQHCGGGGDLNGHSSVTAVATAAAIIDPYSLLSRC